MNRLLLEVCTSRGYAVHLKPIVGNGFVEISTDHSGYDEEKKSFLEKLNVAQPDSFFDFRNAYLTLE